MGMSSLLNTVQGDKIFTGIAAGCRLLSGVAIFFAISNMAFDARIESLRTAFRIHAIPLREKECDFRAGSNGWLKRYRDFSGPGSLRDGALSSHDCLSGASFMTVVE